LGQAGESKGYHVSDMLQGIHFVQANLIRILSSNDRGRFFYAE